MAAGSPPQAFVAVLTVSLHFPDCASLKAKRRELAPVRSHLERRLGASVAEVDHQDHWQRATLVAALAARAPGRLDQATDELQGWLDARFPHGATVTRQLVSLRDLDGL